MLNILLLNYLKTFKQLLLLFIIQRKQWIDNKYICMIDACRINILYVDMRDVCLGRQSILMIQKLVALSGFTLW